MVLAQLALATYLEGRWTEAQQVAEEASELALQTDQRPMHAYSLAIRALVRASLGLEPDARADAQQALAFAGERGMAAARLHSIWALGVLELSLDRPAEVARLLAPERERLLAGGVGEPGHDPLRPRRDRSARRPRASGRGEGVDRLARGARESPSTEPRRSRLRRAAVVCWPPPAAIPTQLLPSSRGRL